ncbi:outer membrane beta-barrel family protein [Muribaculum intestinale]|uniref:outer membrane beta-barrel family protein n=1 Tax=Muribaculum intestinale TaxID=1796646 RepID=UPI0025AA2C13|nr:outer membrane beta-barrel family protein [Muribaculum intestinale]
MRYKYHLLIILILSAWINSHAQDSVPSDSLIRELQEVVVKAKQPATKLVGSSLVSTIAGSNLQNAGNALDVLQQLPMLSVEDNTVSVTGKGTPVIYIDGRPMRDGSELRQLQSSNIRNVELILAPGAQYASTTNAVLKITTRRNFVRGLSISNEVEIRIRRKWSVTDMLDFSYHSGKWELFGTGYYDHDNSLIKGSTTNRLTYEWKPTEIGTTFNSIFPENSALGKLGFNFSEGNQSFGAYYRFMYSHTDPLNTGTEWMDSETPLSRRISGEGNTRNHLVSLYYDNTFADRYHFHFDGNYRGADNDKTNDTRYDYSRRQSINSTQDQNSTLWAGKAYLDFPFAGGDLTVGTQDSYTRTKLDYRMLNQTVGTYIPSSLSDAKQTSLAAFISWARQFGNFSLSAGLRYEYVDYLFTVDGKKDTDVSRTDNFLTPDISLGYFFNENSMINLSYRMATVKPPYSQLTGGLTYAGEHEIEGGNPMLRDEKMHNLQFFGQWKDFMLQVDYIRSLDTYAFVKQIYPAQSLQMLLHPVNVNVSELSTYLIWSHPVRRWQPEVTLGMSKPWMKLGENHYNKPIYSYSFQNSISLPKGFYISANMRGQSSGDMHTNRFAASWFVMDMSLRKTFFNKALAVKLTATDIFNTRNNDWSMDTYGILMNKYQSYDRRGITLSVQYQFQPKKSKYKGKAASEAEMNRL